MPEIVRLSNCKICIYAGDHMPPHFHVRGAGWTASVSLESLEVIKGRGPRNSLDEAIAWAAAPANLRLLAQRWSELNERD